jgi:hypothetical protein
MNKIGHRLAEAYFSPRCPLLDTVWRILEGVQDPSEGWAAVSRAGVLPEEFAKDGRRCYAKDSGTDLPRVSDRPSCDKTPSTVAAVATIASDPHGVLRAELLGRELAERLKPWGAVCNDQVVWSFATQAPNYVGYLGLAYDSARDTVELSLDEYSIDYQRFHNFDTPLPSLLVSRAVAASNAWEFAISHGLKIGGPRWPLDRERYSAFSELANPFQPLIELWLTGYLFVAPFSEEDPSIRLYAKRVKLREQQ